MSFPRTPRRALPALAVGLGVAVAVRADSLYVIEQLVVNVMSAPDPGGERVATVRSGERVEALERVREEVHVRLGDGREGWVRASYLSSDEPLRARLARAETELARLREELARAQAQPPAPRSPAGSEGATAAAAAARTGPGPVTAPAAALFAGATEPEPRRVWPWVLGSSLLALLAGFVLGALLLDRHIRRRYGGLRIY